MDAIEQWTRAQDRMTELVAGLDAATAEKVVPACPDWTVRQLLSHMIGDIAPYLDSFETLGSLPDDDLTETFS